MSLLQQLRRFAQWDSTALLGYTVSGSAMWARADDTGLVNLNEEGLVELDETKVGWLALVYWANE